MGTLQIQKLRNAMQEYEADRWRIIASKVGSGFTPNACRDKAQELEAAEAEEQSGYTQSQMGPPGSSDPGPPFPSSDPNPSFQPSDPNQSFQ